MEPERRRRNNRVGFRCFDLVCLVSGLISVFLLDRHVQVLDRLRPKHVSSPDLGGALFNALGSVGVTCTRSSSLRHRQWRCVSVWCEFECEMCCVCLCVCVWVTMWRCCLLAHCNTFCARTGSGSRCTCTGYVDKTDGGGWAWLCTCNVLRSYIY
jgi:hypothetical protein